VPEETKLEQRSIGNAARLCQWSVAPLAITLQARMARGALALDGEARLLTVSAVEPR
jgi:hypothetical protein